MIAAFEARILGLIDDMVEHATEDELSAEAICAAILRWL